MVSLAEVESMVDEGATAAAFEEFVSKHSKVYSDDEYIRRMGIFAESQRFVRAWNSDPKSKFKVGINEFADLSSEEFAAMYLSTGLEDDSDAALTRASALAETGEGISSSTATWPNVGESLRSGAMHENSGAELPKAVDWSKQHITGDVYKQGVCAACYTFTTNAAIQAEYHIKTGKSLPELSDQEILSCSRKFGNHGCIGGNMEKSYHYIMSKQGGQGGMTLAKDYPYEGSETPCKSDRYHRRQVKLSGFRKVERGSEHDLQDAVAQRPVAVGIDAHHPAFKLYESGVFDIDYCTTHLTHAVLITGYGESNGRKYWQLKNSWGKQWGQDGYGHIARGANMCAIANLASYPVLEQPETWSEALLASESESRESDSN